ncbi:hypothetical protein LCGC14_1408970 [marine sediment metagenome]|uniref:Uncharacterized protein n=1 Tax=marine sediment metagenome TaxID=412755 RepID=A0A0F9JV50_9ZZZZ
MIRMTNKALCIGCASLGTGDYLCENGRLIEFNGVMIKDSPPIKQYCEICLPSESIKDFWQEKYDKQVVHTAKLVMEREKKIIDLTYALKLLHDESCDIGRGKRLDLGPMIAPSEWAVLSARKLLEE